MIVLHYTTRESADIACAAARATGARAYVLTMRSDFHEVRVWCNCRLSAMHGESLSEIVTPQAKYIT